MSRLKYGGCSRTRPAGAPEPTHSGLIPAASADFFRRRYPRIWNSPIYLGTSGIDAPEFLEWNALPSYAAIRPSSP